MRQGKGTELCLECSSTLFGGCFIGSAVKCSVKSITELFEFEQSTYTPPQHRHSFKFAVPHNTLISCLV